MLKKTLLTTATLAAALGLAACDVQKTQEGNVTTPKYEVEKTRSGDVTLPKYDVTAPTVSVGTASQTVTVPTVSTEQRKVEVPTVAVTPARDK
jgi:hypothetical protein